MGKKQEEEVEEKVEEGGDNIAERRHIHLSSANNKINERLFYCSFMYR